MLKIIFYIKSEKINLKSESPIFAKVTLGKEGISIEVKKIQLLDIFEKHNNEFAKKVKSEERSSASLQKYKRLADLIKNFIRKTYNVNNINIEKINSSFIYNLETYLKFESEFKGVIGIKNNSLVKYYYYFLKHDFVII